MQPSLKVLPYNILHKCLLYLLYENCFNCHLLLLSPFSRVQVFRTLWTVARQAPLFMDYPGKNTGVGCHDLLQRIFSTQGWNPGLLHCRQILYHLSHQGSPYIDHIFFIHSSINGPLDCCDYYMS